MEWLRKITSSGRTDVHGHCEPGGAGSHARRHPEFGNSKGGSAGASGMGRLSSISGEPAGTASGQLLRRCSQNRIPQTFSRIHSKASGFSGIVARSLMRLHNFDPRWIANVTGRWCGISNSRLSLNRPGLEESDELLRVCARNGSKLGGDTALLSRPGLFLTSTGLPVRTPKCGSAS